MKVKPMTKEQSELFIKLNTKRKRLQARKDSLNRQREDNEISVSEYHHQIARVNTSYNDVIIRLKELKRR